MSGSSGTSSVGNGVGDLGGKDNGRGMSAASKSEIRDSGERIVGITEGTRMGPISNSGIPIDDNLGVLDMDGISGMLSISPAVS
jgi:hypothetical protein